jgi:heat shock protein HslJ
VNIVKNQHCSDGMSDRVYPDKVQVTVDGRQFNGCGGL